MIPLSYLEKNLKTCKSVSAEFFRAKKKKDVQNVKKAQNASLVFDLKAIFEVLSHLKKLNAIPSYFPGKEKFTTS